eukprot:5297166-Pleurochrysis_carterae.AAC.1
MLFEGLALLSVNYKPLQTQTGSWMPAGAAPALRLKRPSRLARDTLASRRVRRYIVLKIQKH